MEDLESGDTDILVGTHAIIQPDVKFKSLGLVITDEQHRFGVNQRSLLAEKGSDPNGPGDDGYSYPQDSGSDIVR